MTPTDLEHAIEVNQRLLRRRKFNEETRRSEYHPPLTDEELEAMLKSDEQIYFALAFRERIYAQFPEPERSHWKHAIRNVYNYVTSKMYQEAAEDVLRTKYDDDQTAAQNRPGPQMTT